MSLICVHLGTARSLSPKSPWTSALTTTFTRARSPGVSSRARAPSSRGLHRGHQPTDRLLERPQRAVLLGSCLVPTRARFRLGFDQRDFNRSEGTRLARAHAAVRKMSQKVVTRGRIMVCISIF